MVCFLRVKLTLITLQKARTHAHRDKHGDGKGEDVMVGGEDEWVAVEGEDEWVVVDREGSLRRVAELRAAVDRATSNFYHEMQEQSDRTTRNLMRLFQPVNPLNPDLLNERIREAKIQASEDAEKELYKISALPEEYKHQPNAKGALARCILELRNAEATDDHNGDNKPTMLCTGPPAQPPCARVNWCRQ